LRNIASYIFFRGSKTRKEIGVNRKLLFSHHWKSPAAPPIELPSDCSDEKEDANPSSTLCGEDLDELLERAVDGRPDVGNVLPELDRRHGTLGNALGGELELLYAMR
jgi:hypothetical protein